jgi:hypothetical protein
MAFTGNAMCTSFKVEILDAYHNFGTGPTRGSGAADSFYIALYTNSATLDATTTAYTTSGEVSSSGTAYTAGGNLLTISQVPTYTSTTAWLDFADTTWAASTITARGALIYNYTQANRSVAVLDFGSDKTSTAGDFTIVFPAANSSSAIIRIA